MYIAVKMSNGEEVFGKYKGMDEENDNYLIEDPRSVMLMNTQQGPRPILVPYMLSVNVDKCSVYPINKGNVATPIIGESSIVKSDIFKEYVAQTSKIELVT